MKKIYVVYNAHAGSALSRRELKCKCKLAGLTVEKFVPVDEHMRRRLAAPIAKGVIVVVIGGDGTISGVANLLVDTSSILAPIAGGTFNHFTKDAGVPLNISEALQRVRTAKPRLVDTVKVNDTYFINNSLLGLYPHSLEVRSQYEGKYGKWWAMAAGLLASLVRFRTYKLEIEGKTYKTPFVFVGNNSFGLERAGLSGRQRLDGAEMDVYIARTQSRFGMAKLLVQAGLGAVKNEAAFVSFTDRQTVSVKSSRKRMHVAHDGELTTMKTPITYTLCPKSLRIL